MLKLVDYDSIEILLRFEHFQKEDIHVKCQFSRKGPLCWHHRTEMSYLVFKYSKVTHLLVLTEAMFSNSILAQKTSCHVSQ
jgi:hypothetical protein